MNLHALQEVGPIAALCRRPENLRCGARTRPHLPLEFRLIAGILRPVTALAAKNPLMLLGRNSFERIILVGFF